MSSILYVDICSSSPGRFKCYQSLIFLKVCQWIHNTHSCVCVIITWMTPKGQWDAMFPLWCIDTSMKSTKVFILQITVWILYYILSFTLKRFWKKTQVSLLCKKFIFSIINSLWKFTLMSRKSILFSDNWISNKISILTGTIESTIWKKNYIGKNTLLCLPHCQKTKKTKQKTNN